jgi:hypothetical protein
MLITWRLLFLDFAMAWLSSRPDKLQTRRLAFASSFSSLGRTWEAASTSSACIIGSFHQTAWTSPRSAVESLCIWNRFRCSNPLISSHSRSPRGLGHQTHLPQSSARASIHPLTCSIHAEWDVSACWQLWIMPKCMMTLLDGGFQVQLKLHRVDARGLSRDLTSLRCRSWSVHSTSCLQLFK